METLGYLGVKSPFAILSRFFENWSLQGRHFILQTNATIIMNSNTMFIVIF